MANFRTIEDRTLVSLRVFKEQAQAAARRLQLAPPLMMSGTEPGSLWMGPHHWLIMHEAEEPQVIMNTCSDHLGDISHVVTNSSDALVIIRLSGESVRELLASGCGLDFRRRSFAENACQQTRFAQIPMTICSLVGAEFELIFDRTYLNYIKHWMDDSLAIQERCLAAQL